MRVDYSPTLRETECEKRQNTRHGSLPDNTEIARSNVMAFCADKSSKGEGGVHCGTSRRTMARLRFQCIAFACAFAVSRSQSIPLGPPTFTAPGAFPTSVYKHYFNNPTQTFEQVQPVITDPVTVRTAFHQFQCVDTLVLCSSTRCIHLT